MLQWEHSQEEVPPALTVYGQCYETRWGPRAYRGAGCSARTWLQLMCCTTRCLLSSNVGCGFGGLDEEFGGQPMLISDWGTYMKFGMYIYRKRAYQGNKDWAYISVGVQGLENRTRGTKMWSRMETWNKAKFEYMKRGGMEFGDVLGIGNPSHQFRCEFQYGNQMEVLSVRYSHHVEAKFFKFRKCHGKHKISEKSKTWKKHFVFKVTRKIYRKYSVTCDIFHSVMCDMWYVILCHMSHFFWKFSDGFENIVFFFLMFLIFQKFYVFHDIFWIWKFWPLRSVTHSCARSHTWINQYCKKWQEQIPDVRIRRKSEFRRLHWR